MPAVGGRRAPDRPDRRIAARAGPAGRPV